ncbi:MAG TPA: 3-oxoacyl-[acyl-carrier-protein] synthase III C-terminal domain-containing protein [Verrucomicrobiae bacterium]|jgi:alkylresorcinol/alkylpyrone synthase
MFIAGLGTAAPPQRYAQCESWEALKNSPQFPKLKPRSRAILKKVLCGENGIAARHLALEPLSEVFDQTPDALQARFTRHTPALATQAAKRALKNANCAAKEIDAVIISTCTGYLCPGLTSYVSEQLGLRENVFALDLVGQGCGAALPNLRAAESILTAGRAKKILSVCVEVCSAAFFLDDDPGVLISACLFADGAGAAILSNQPHPKNKRRVEWKFASSNLAPDKRQMLRFSHKNGMLRNILSPRIPQIAGDEVAKLFSQSLAAAKIKRKEITGWILHTGGRDVILSLREKLNLTEADVRHSAAVLREFGNISSPTVYFVLERALKDVPDGLWWMCAFGAGFSCHGAFLEVGGA